MASASDVLGTSLPVLRPDVEFRPGPDEPDGSPTYVLHDPLRGTFDKLSWPQAEVVRRLRQPQTLVQLLRQLDTHTTLKVTPEDVGRLCADVVRRRLTMDSCVAGASSAAPNARQAQRPDATGGRGAGLATWLRRLAFLRIPLVHPAALLEGTVGTVRHLGRPSALVAYACIALTGLVLLAQRFDEYLTTFPYFFNWAGAVAFALTIAAVRIVHELSHAYVATALGCRVRTLGVTLIFLFPVPYADVTDSWRLASRRKRLLISLAGVLAELVLAGAALCVWAASPAGLLRSVCFLVSSTTLLSTLLLNLNPAMRYDGYYVLSDLLGIDNLQARSFGVTRWLLRRHLLGLNVPSPEPQWPARRLALVAAYALLAWAYRLFMYTAIALMLYHRVTKVLGAVLFCVAIGAFLVQPVVAEVGAWFRLRSLLKRRARALLPAAALAGLLLWLGLPLPRRCAVPAITVAQASQAIYAPGDGVLQELAIDLDSPVQRGQTLFVLASQELACEAALARLDVQRIELERALIRGDEQQRAWLPAKREELERAQARLSTVAAAMTRSRFVAAVDGRVAQWDASLRSGTAIGAKHVLGLIASDARPNVVCYAPDQRAADLNVGDRVWFCSDAGSPPQAGTVTFTDAARVRYLEHRALSSVGGGDIAVRPDGRDRLEVLDSFYRVEVALDDDRAPPRVGQTGRVWLRSRPRSYLADVARYSYRTLLRESGF